MIRIMIFISLIRRSNILRPLMSRWRKKSGWNFIDEVENETNLATAYVEVIL